MLNYILRMFCIKVMEGCNFMGAYFANVIYPITSVRRYMYLEGHLLL